MLTILSVPKPFQGHIGVIQCNAINSWLCLHPHCEIILCGDEPGTREMAAELKVEWIPDIARNEYGTPLLDSVFDQVARAANHHLLCYVNADVILLSDFTEAVQRIRSRKFLMVGQRWNVNLTEPVDFCQPGWEERLRRHVTKYGVLNPRSAIDYFVFPRDSGLGKLPPFVVGRPGWDNWFIYNARRLGVPVIDATRAVTIVHQNHGYNHVPDQRGKSWNGPEADRNRLLMGNPDYTFTLLDATHIMTPRTLRPALGYKYLQRRLKMLLVLGRATRPLVLFLRVIRARPRSRNRPLSLR